MLSVGPSAEDAKMSDAIDQILAAGNVLGGHRTRQKARTLVPALKVRLGVAPGDTTFDPALEDFIIDVILGAAWYVRKYQSARVKAYWFIAANAALVVGVPTALYLASRDMTATGAVALLSGLLTGIFALQKTLSAWFAQQQRYAAWYQCTSDLKQIYYGLLRQHPAGQPDQPSGSSRSLVDDLSAGADQARKIINSEQLAFYQSLALPTMDVLDMLTGSSATVAKLITSLMPAAVPESPAKATNFLTVGTKAIGVTAATPNRTPSDRVDFAAGMARDAVPGATGTLPSFDSATVVACADRSLASAADLEQVFAIAGGFFAWYNRALSGTLAFRHRGKARDDNDINKHFTSFWDQMGVTFGTTPISLVEFCALMSINIEETTGDLTAAPEEVNGMNHPHPGLAYAFDRIPGLKQSYNRSPNKTALELFSDADFVAAHGGLPGAQIILNRPGGIDPAWGGDTWPAGADARPDGTVNGFVMQADFYKFRGRGVIQTTWRDAYKEILRFLLSDNPMLEPGALLIRNQWLASAGTLSGDPALEFVLTTSTTQQWDKLFESPLVLAQGVHIDSSQKRNYLRLSHDVTVLSGDRMTIGSLMRMAATINGGDYPSRVVPMMKTMMSGVAELVEAVATA
jgi:hypothetical protein